MAAETSCDQAALFSPKNAIVMSLAQHLSTIYTHHEGVLRYFESLSLVGAVSDQMNAPYITAKGSSAHNKASCDPTRLLWASIFFREHPSHPCWRTIYIAWQVRRSGSLLPSPSPHQPQKLTEAFTPTSKNTMRALFFALVASFVLAQFTSACNTRRRGRTRIEAFPMTSPRCQVELILTQLQCGCGILQKLGLLSPFTRNMCRNLFPTPPRWLSTCSKRDLRACRLFARLRIVNILRIRTLRSLTVVARVCFRSRGTRPVSSRVLSSGGDTSRVISSEEKVHFQESFQLMPLTRDESTDDVMESVEKCAKCMTCFERRLCTTTAQNSTVIEGWGPRCCAKLPS